MFLHCYTAVWHRMLLGCLVCVLGQNRVRVYNSLSMYFTFDLQLVCVMFLLLCAVWLDSVGFLGVQQTCKNGGGVV